MVSAKLSLSLCLLCLKFFKFDLFSCKTKTKKKKKNPTINSALSLDLEKKILTGVEEKQVFSPCTLTFVKLVIMLLCYIIIVAEC